MKNNDVPQTNRPNRKQPEKERRFDKTALHHNIGRMIHRDYAAHWFRWGFADQLIKLPNNRHRVLDVGCGTDLALCYILCFTNNQTLRPDVYVGVDLNDVKKRPDSPVVKVHAPFNFVDDWRELLELYEPFTHAVCYEVIEHMAPADACYLLKGVYQLLAKDGIFLLSTPVYDGKAKAHNHIHEYTVEELQQTLEANKFKVERRFGTFMNANMIKKVAPPEYVELVNKLRDFYSWNVLANFLAPLYPDASRNNLWGLTKR
jgi:2-polyprenyl-3-methyl-5-hydroxy-6-metoxy-1,4-benzoquinol methylase